MPAPVILVQATPRQPADGTAVPVRLAGGGGEHPYYYDAQHWRAGIASLPRSVSSLDFDGEQLGGGGVVQALELIWSPATNAALASLADLFWADAPIAIRIGPEGAAMPPVDTVGLVLNTSVQSDGLHIAMAEAAVDLKRPLLVDRFAGTGGLEGPAEWAGQIKSRTWGRCFNVLGKLIDQAANVWCFGDPYRAWRSFDAIRDKGVAAAPAALTFLDWQGTAAATYQALQSALVEEGGGVLCPSIACVKWWTAPAGALYADVQGEVAGGYVDTAPAIAARIIAARSTLTIADATLAAAIVARPAVCGWRVESDSSTAADEISDLLGGVSLSWMIVGGEIEFRRWEWGSPARTARSEGVTRSKVFKPVATRTLGYRRNWSPLARSDLAAAVLASDVTYDDGTTAQQLQPATAGATAGAPAGTSIGGAVQADGTVAGGTPVEVVLSAMVQIDQIAPAIPKIVVDVSALQEAGVHTDAAIGALADARVDLEAADRQAARDGAAISDAVLRLVTEAGRTRDVLRDAGVVVDPVTGSVRLYAVDQLADRTSRAEVALDAARATITTKASVDYVDEAVLLAQLDPSTAAELKPLFARVTSAENDIDGLQAAVALKASALDLAGVSGRLSTVSETLDALAGTVTTKADSTVVDALARTVTSVEQTLGAYGDVVGLSIDVRQARSVADDAAEAGLRALLGGDQAARRQNVSAAEARQELSTRLTDGLAAEATARTLLAAQLGAADARAVEQLTALASADKVQAQRIDALGVTSGDQAAAIGTLQEAAITARGGVAALTTTVRQQAGAGDGDAEATLRALIAGDDASRARAAQLVQVQSQLTTTLVANELASATARQALIARMAAAEAAIVATSTVMTDRTQSLASRLDAAEAAYADPVTGLPATRAALKSETVARATAVKAQSDRTDAIEATIADPATGLPATHAQVVAQGRALAAGDQANADAIQQVSAGLGAEATARDAGDQANAGAIGLVAASVTAEQQARTDAVSAVAQSVQQVRASMGAESTARDAGDQANAGAIGAVAASVTAEQKARTDAVSAVAQSVQQVSASLGAESTARDAGDQANASAIGTVAASVTAEQQARVDAVGAVARSVEQVSTTVGGHSASIELLFESIDGQHAVAQLAVDVDGRVTGFRINGHESVFEIAAERFVVGSSRIFEVDQDTGIVTMDTIRVANIRSSAVQKTQVFALAADITVAPGN